MKIDRLLSDQEILEELADRFKDFRQKKGWSQSEVAERSALNRNTVSNAENAENPTLMTVIRLLRVYGKLNQLEAIGPAEDEVQPKELYNKEFKES